MSARNGLIRKSKQQSADPHEARDKIRQLRKMCTYQVKITPAMDIAIICMMCNTNA